MIRTCAAVATLAVLAACSTSAKPPPHAGIVVVHVVSAAGPEGPGVDPTQGPIAGTSVGLRAGRRAERTAQTNDRGDATFVVSPGVYVARLTDLQGFDGKGGTLNCVSGDDPRRVTIPPDGRVRVSFACWGDG